ncbi:PREDICTED: uncharacterized protein LOC107357902 isoform X3 [Acropora digitifera]|nr:PREDICTED: uncharacterized protein LOC107357902 isoform X3 [Acropora digitifera]
MMELLHDRIPETDDEDSVDGTEGSEESTESQSLQLLPFEFLDYNKVGKNQSEEDNLSSMLRSYKEDHPSFYRHISETAKIIRSLRNLLARGQLATKGALTKVDSLFNISTLHRQPIGAIVADFLVDVDVPELLTEVLRSFYQKYPNLFSSEEQSNSEVKWALKVINSISMAILNFSDLHDNFCEACGEAGVVEECWELLRGLKTCTHNLSDRWIILEGPEGTADQFSEIGRLGFNVLGVLHNLLKRLDTDDYFESCGNLETLLSFYRSQFPKYRMTALLCLAYLVDEENNYLIMATEDFSEPIKDLLKLLEGACNSYDRRCQGFSATEIAQGLSFVARNDSNKRMIGQLGGIPLLAAMLEDETDEIDPEEGFAALEALYMLSFDEENKAIIKADKDKGLLENLHNSSDKGIQQAASGVIWEIEGKKEHISKSSESEEHIMISYPWKYKKAMQEVKTELESEGLRVWMDVDKMTGNILQTMARAVENSSVILIAMSREYQNSTNCRSEAEYAYELRKKIIPLMMEKNFKPDGWLGIIKGTKLYMHFEKDPREGIQQLLKEIKNVTATVSEQSEVSAQPEVLSAPPPMQEAKKRVLSWKKEDVAKWLESIGFDVGENGVRGNLDGCELCRLNELRKESPEFFYSSIKTDLALSNVIAVMKFTEELKQLLN